MPRLTYAHLVRQVRDARGYTTNGGCIAVHITECPECGAFPHMLCKAIYGSGEETYSIHAARSRAAATILSAPLIHRRDVHS